MRTIIMICMLTAVGGTAVVWQSVSTPDRFGTFIQAPQADVGELIAKPQDYLHKTVSIQGEVRRQCSATGCCFFFIQGENMLRVDLGYAADRAITEKRNHVRVNSCVCGQ